MGQCLSCHITTETSLPLPQRISSDLNSYVKACEQDPDLQSFDSKLRQQTQRAVESLSSMVDQRTQQTVGSLDHETEDRGSLPFDCFIGAMRYFLVMNQEVVEFILESREDVTENEELLSLVSLYFDSSKLTLDFCNALERCVKRIETSKLILGSVTAQFEKETSMETKGVVERKYAKTLDELQKFKASGNPFEGQDFSTLLESMYRQQVQLLDELAKQKRKSNKKLSQVQKSKVWNILFITSFVSALILSVSATAMGAPALVLDVTAAMVGGIGVGRWYMELWKSFKREEQKETVNLNHQMIVDYVRLRFATIHKKIDVVLNLQAAEVESALDEIKRDFDLFSESIEEVGKHADNCYKAILRARNVVLTIVYNP